MNGLSKSINLDLLKYVRLLQVSIGKNQFILHFDDNILISVECDCIYYSSEKEQTLIVDYVKNSFLICSLIDEKILDASLDDAGGLIINFSNNAILHLLNDSELYESFQLRIKEDLYVA